MQHYLYYLGIVALFAKILILLNIISIIIRIFGLFNCIIYIISCIILTYLNKYYNYIKNNYNINKNKIFLINCICKKYELKTIYYNYKKINCLINLFFLLMFILLTLFISIIIYTIYFYISHNIYNEQHNNLIHNKIISLNIILILIKIIPILYIINILLLFIILILVNKRMNSEESEIYNKKIELQLFTLRKIANIIDSHDDITQNENKIINEYLLNLFILNGFDYNSTHLHIINKSLFKFNYFNHELKKYLIDKKRNEITDEKELNDYIDKLQLKIFKINDLSLIYIYETEDLIKF